MRPMEGGSADSGYYAIRMKSAVPTEVEHGGTRTQEKHCVTPGSFCVLVFLLLTRTGESLALLNDGVLQHMRVGADSAIGTKRAARQDARVLGMLGSGGMARSQLEALFTVRPLERVQVYSPTRRNRERYAREIANRHGIEVVAVDEPRDVFRGADVVTGCTDTVADVIVGDWLEPGTHVTCSIGGRPDARTREVVDVWLRFGTAPLNDPSWWPTDVYLVCTARSQEPVWDWHRHGKVRRPPEGPGAPAPRVPPGRVDRPCAREEHGVRDHLLGARQHPGCTVLRRGGATCTSSAARRASVVSCRPSGSCRTPGTDPTRRWRFDTSTPGRSRRQRCSRVRTPAPPSRTLPRRTWPSSAAHPACQGPPGRVVERRRGRPQPHVDDLSRVRASGRPPIQVTWVPGSSKLPMMTSATASVQPASGRRSPGRHTGVVLSSSTSSSRVRATRGLSGWSRVTLIGLVV